MSIKTIGLAVVIDENPRRKKREEISFYFRNLSLAMTSATTAVQQFIGYVIGTQIPKTLKVRVPKEIYLPKYQKVFC
jgi:hypothetical protein